MQKNLTEHICRICLKNCEIMISLYDEVEDFQTKLCDLLENVCNMKIDSKDNYPKYICNECTTELLITVKFIEKCRKTEDILSCFVANNDNESLCEDSMIVIDNGNDDNQQNDDSIDENLIVQYDEDDDDDDDDDIVNEENICKNDNEVNHKNLTQVESSTSIVTNKDDFNEFIIQDNVNGDCCNNDELMIEEDNIETRCKRVMQEKQDEEEITVTEIENSEDDTNYIIFDGDELDEDIIAEIQLKINERNNDDDDERNRQKQKEQEEQLHQHQQQPQQQQDNIQMKRRHTNGTRKSKSNDQILHSHRTIDVSGLISTGKCSIKNSSSISKPQVINSNCDVCGAGFTHLNNLRRHLEAHGLEEIYECAICLWPFSEYNKLEKHSLSEHSQILLNNQQLDQQTQKVQNGDMNNDEQQSKEIKNGNLENYNLLTDYDAENESRKDGKKYHLCHECNKPFVSRSALTAHIRTHTGDRPFKCIECSKTFTTQGGLALHMRRHMGLRPFECNICGKSFVETSNLKVHMRIHTGEKPHKCTICGRDFSRVFLLQIHQRTHTGERPYKCPYCNKGFAQQGDLSTHKKIHTGERPHKCSFCDKGFIKSSALNIHMRKHTRFLGSHGRKHSGNKSGSSMKPVEQMTNTNSQNNNNSVDVGGGNNDDGGRIVKQNEKCDTVAATADYNDHDDDDDNLHNILITTSNDDGTEMNNLMVPSSNKSFDNSIIMMTTSTVPRSAIISDINDDDKMCIIHDLDSIMIEVDAKE